MVSTVLSKGCFYEAIYLLEILLQHDADDSFVFRLSYKGVKFSVYIYPNYSYMVILKTLVEPSVHYLTCSTVIAVVESFVEKFLRFCLGVNTNHIYNCEQEIGHYVLMTFAAHIIDWSIWYSFFSLPYRMLKIRHNSCDENCDERGNFFQRNNIAYCVVEQTQETDYPMLGDIMRN
jgi:hypothetical protein